MSMRAIVDLSDSVLRKKIEIYRTQIKKMVERLVKILDTKDQDYISTYIKKVIETSFHRGYLPQKDIISWYAIMDVAIRRETNVRQQ